MGANPLPSKRALDRRLDQGLETFGLRLEKDCSTEVLKGSATYSGIILPCVRRLIRLRMNDEGKLLSEVGHRPDGNHKIDKNSTQDEWKAK